MSEERWPKTIWEWTKQGRRREDDHEGPGPIISRRAWQPGTLMSKISRTVRGGEEVARNVRKVCRILEEEDEIKNSGMGGTCSTLKENAKRIQTGKYG
jgi:hypothetical protein